MLTKGTAAKIWGCYREIEAGEELLKDMEELKKRYPYDEYASKLKDAFGRGQDLQLGIPSGENSHRLIGVKPELAQAIIRAHIKEKMAKLAALNEIAFLESKE